MKTAHAALLCLLPALGAAVEPLETIPVEEHPAPEPRRAAMQDSFVRGYYVASNKIKSDDLTISGDGGFGIGGLLAIGLADTGMHPFLIGDYQRTRFDDFDATEENIRLGLGWRFSPAFGAYVEHAEIRFDNTLEGLGMHLRVTPWLDHLHLAFDVGYLDLDNDRGPQVEGVDVGIALGIPFAQAFSALVDYRATLLSPEDGDSATLSDFRVGVRYNLLSP